MTLARSAFTIVEMLVIVAIIALLTGLMLPMVGRSKQAARQSVCMSNLGQLGRAVDLFALDHQQRYFEYRQVITGEAEGTRWWFGFEPATGAATNRPLDHGGGVLGPYLAGIGERLQCDDFPYHSADHITKFARPAASYGYNWKLSGMRKLGATTEIPDQQIRPQTRARYRDRLSEVFLFADSIFFEPHANPGAFFEGYYIAWQANPAALSGYAHYRHMGQANVLFLDGHAAPRTLAGGVHKTIEGAAAANLTGADPAQVYGD